MPRTFVLYVGDHPSKLSLAAMLRNGTSDPKIARVTVRSGRPGIVDVEPIDPRGDKPCFEWAITPERPGFTSLLVQSFSSTDGDHALKGQCEIVLDVRPADGHTIVPEIGLPDESLAPPPPPDRDAELPVASARPISSKNADGSGQGEQADQAAGGLRASLLERLKLPQDASDSDIQAAITAQMEAACTQGTTEAAAKKQS